MAQFQFDATQVEPDAGRRGPAPKGWYTLVLTKSPIEPAGQGGDGLRINAQFSIFDGDYKGGVVFHNFNIKNASEKAVEISAKQLSALAHATGKLKIQATDEWHNIPFRARLKITEEQGYESKNEITAFAHISDASAVDRATTAVTNGNVTKITPPQQSPAAQQAWNQQAQVVHAQQPPPAQAAPAPAAQTWTAPAAQQPWSPPAEAIAAQQAQQQAPVQQQAPAQQAPAWNPNPNVSTAAPVTDAPVQQSIPAPSQIPQAVQQVVTTATQDPATAPAPSPIASAPAEAAPAGQVMPPWLQQAQQ